MYHLSSSSPTSHAQVSQKKKHHARSPKQKTFVELNFNVSSKHHQSHESASRSNIGTHIPHKSSLGRLFVLAAMYQKITEVLKEGKTGMGKWTLETKPVHVHMASHR